MGAVDKKIGMDILCPFSDKFTPLKQNVNGRFYYHVRHDGGVIEVRLPHEIDTTEDLREMCNVTIRNEEKPEKKPASPSIRNENTSIQNEQAPDVPDFGHNEPAPVSKPAPAPELVPDDAPAPVPVLEKKWEGEGDGYFDELFGG